MRGFFKIFLVCAVIVSVPFSNLKARNSDRDLNIVLMNFSKMEDVLNERSDLSPAVSFLHNLISDKAVFTVQVSNPTLPKAVQGEVIEMSKSDYINSFIQGSNFIENYKIKITVENVDIEEKTGEVVSRHVLVESGLMKNPHQLHKPGQDFISRTSCTSHHAVKEGASLLLNSKCRTDVSFAEEV